MKPSRLLAAGAALVAVFLAAGAAGDALAQASPPQPPSPGQASPPLEVPPDVPLAPGSGQAAPQPRQAPPRIGDDLARTRWRAETVQGKPVPKGAELTIEFLEDDLIRGNGGCNRYVGPIATRADKVVLGPLSRTKRACGPPLDRQETTYLETLERTERMRLESKGQVLLVFSSLSDQPSRFARMP